MKNADKYEKLFETADAVLLTSVENRNYCTQFPLAEGMLLLTKGERFCFTDSRYLEAAQKGLKGFTVLEVSRAQPYSARILDALQDCGAAKIGFEEDAVTQGVFMRLSEKLGMEMLPMQKEIDAPRSSKEPWELERMRKAQSITDRTFSDILPKIAAGMTEKELERALIMALYQNGAEGLAFDPIVVSGENTSLPHGVASEKKLQYGDFVTLDFGAKYGGYCSDMTRTVALGFVTGQMREVYDTVLAAQETAILATAAGMTGKELDAVARGVIEEAGYGAYFTHSYGHSLGLAIHESPNASPANDDPLPRGAVLSAEPGIYLPGKFGVRIEDVVVIGQNGAENLTSSPKNLIIL